MPSTPSRNAPCPCGSGKKYKQCCGLAKSASPDEPGQPDKPRKHGFLLLLVVLTFGLVIAIGIRMNHQRALPDAADGAAHEPWEYDAANDRHWHAEHGHWHDGPPPADAPGSGPMMPPTVPSPLAPLRQDVMPQEPSPATSEATSSPDPTPAPWYYDQANNRHWHPSHAHWHDGPPPPAAMR